MVCQHVEMIHGATVGAGSVDQLDAFEKTELEATVAGCGRLRRIAESIVQDAIGERQGRDRADVMTGQAGEE